MSLVGTWLSNTVGLLLKPLVATIVFIITLYIAVVVSFTDRVGFVFLCTWINSHFRPDDYFKSSP